MNGRIQMKAFQNTLTDDGSCYLYIEFVAPSGALQRDVAMR